MSSTQSTSDDVSERHNNPLKSIEKSLQIMTTINEVRSWREGLMKQGKVVGFVPTMGALHDGHIALTKQSMKECDATIVSIFVNPTQFLPGEDFAAYPRQLDADSSKLRDAGVDVLFAPSAIEMYPHLAILQAQATSQEAELKANALMSSSSHVGASSSIAANSAPFQGTYVDPAGADDLREGKMRPGHFRGVATVVTKLFNIVSPTRAYFGQKDGLQCIIIRKIVRDLNMPIKVIVCDTVREPDGLAMSSRNVYLSKTQREKAPQIYQGMCQAKQAWNEGQRRVGALKEVVLKHYGKFNEIDVFEPQYVVISDGYTGIDLDDDVVLGGDDAYVMLAVAVKAGKTRLIDNMMLGTKRD